MYVVFVLVACAFITVCCLRCYASSKRFRDGFLALQVWIKCNSDYITKFIFIKDHKWFNAGGTNHACETRLHTSERTHESCCDLWRQLVLVVCVGALITLGDFIGVFGSGTGIMLVVTTLYPYLMVELTMLVSLTSNRLHCAEQDQDTETPNVTLVPSHSKGKNSLH